MSQPGRGTITYGLYHAATRGFGQHAPRQAEPGRICAEAGCGTRLSVYNLDPVCALHEPLHPQRSPRRTSHPEQTAKALTGEWSKTSYTVDQRLWLFFFAHRGLWWRAREIMAAVRCEDYRTLCRAIGALRRQGVVVEARQGRGGGYRLAGAPSGEQEGT